MNLIIITQRDPVFIDSFLKSIEYSVFDDVVIYDVPNFGKGKVTAFRRYLALFGVRPTIRTVWGVLFGKKDLNLKNGLIKKLSFTETLHDIKQLSIQSSDILLSVSAPKRIPESILALFGAKLNFHCGKLPEYAGMMPMFWQRYDNRQTFTVTLHEMSESIDEGDILYEKTVEFGEDLLNDMIKSKVLSAKIFNDFIAGKVDVCRRPGVSVLRLRSFPKPNEIAEFKGRLK